MLRTLVCTLAIITTFVASEHTSRAAAQEGRALTIEDYYRVKNVGGTQISPDGRWVLFNVSTRVEENQGTKNETFVVATDGAAQARHITHEGRDVTGARWSDDNEIQYTVERQQFKVNPSGGSPASIASGPDVDGGGRQGGGRGRGGAVGGRGARVPSPDGQWIIVTRDKTPPKNDPQHASDCEKRHQERFKGAIFDWKDFQRDGQPFPAPDPTAQPAVEILKQEGANGTPATLVDRDFRPSNITWHPDGRSIVFTADPNWRDPLRYSRSDLWMVTLDGALTQMTKDAYNYSDPGFSPDGRYLSYARTYGTDMVIQQKLNHGGPRDLYVRPASGTGAEINVTANWDLEPGDSR